MVGVKEDQLLVLIVKPVLGEDMRPQEHWMDTLQGVFYPALAAVGIPCKYHYTSLQGVYCANR